MLDFLRKGVSKNPEMKPPKWAAIATPPADSMEEGNAMTC